MSSDDLLAKLRALPPGRFVDDETLWELATGELPAPDARRIEAILAQDPELAARFSAIQADLTAMRSFEDAAPPPSRDEASAPRTAVTLEAELGDDARRQATARLGLRFIHTLRPDQDAVAREAIPFWVDTVARGGATLQGGNVPLAFGGGSEGEALVRLLAEHLRRWLDALEQGNAGFDGPPQPSTADAGQLARMAGYRLGFLGGRSLARALGESRARLAGPLRPGAEPGRVVMAGSETDRESLRSLAEALGQRGFRVSSVVETDGPHDGLPIDETAWEALLRPAEVLVLVGRGGTLTRRLSELALRFLATSEGGPILPVALSRGAWHLPLPARLALELSGDDGGRLARQLAWIRLEILG